MIPYSRQNIDKKDVKSVTKVLNSDFLTQGPMVQKFENNIKIICKSKYASAVNSATSALHLSCLSLGLKKNDYLWTSPISFVASSNCGLYCGARIDFIDINIKNFNIDILKLKHKLEIAKKRNKLPKILVVVHMGGLSCDMFSIKRLSNKYGFKIIEDASHCVGSKYNGYPAGSCKYSDLSVLSFHPVKIITTGEGGMILTNNKNLDKKIKILRTSGINKNVDKKKIKKEGDWYYEQQMLGYNYRMSDIAAALGISQLKKLQNFIKQRNQIALNYRNFLKNLPIEFQHVNKKSLSSYHLFIIRVSSKIRKKLFDKMRKNGFFVNIHYIPIHLQPYYKKLGFKKGMFPVAEKYYKEALSIPIYPNLIKKNQLKIISIIKNILKK
tara:strand:- start:317 stop:1465 length:1149 start_codon:yes stop_codon:yes gene_type:complete